MWTDSLVVNYAIEAIARERGPLRTCFILDEFPQLPPAPAVMKALRLYRDKGIQLWFFSQGRYSMEGAGHAMRSRRLKIRPPSSR